MKGTEIQDTRWDELLRKALPDDLPPDVRAGMQERIGRVRADRELRHERRAAAGPWLFRRPVLAALSVLLLAAGIVIQARRPSTPLADRISSIKSAYARLETTRR